MWPHRGGQWPPHLIGPGPQSRKHADLVPWAEELGWPRAVKGLTFDNGAHGHAHADKPPRPLYVPGLLGCPMAAEKPAEERFAHGLVDWTQPRMVAREVEMLQAMNAYTDQPNWHLSVGEWDGPERLSNEAREWCRRELQDMALRFNETGYVLAFDSGSRICKSDVAIPRPLLEALRSGADRLCVPQRNNGSSWDPVDPSMFPLILGRTRVLLDGRQVPRQTAAEYSGQGRIPPVPRLRRPQAYGRDVFETQLRDMLGQIQYETAHFYRASDRFQRLPCEVRFTPGRAPNSVEITSYINNLDPRRHQGLYETIEEVLRHCIDPWNEVLAYCGRPRTPRRILTYGLQWDPPRPWTEEDASDVATESTTDESESENMTENPSSPQSPRPASSTHTAKDYGRIDPEPGVSFTYDDWKRGKAGRPIVNGRQIPTGEPMQSDKPDHEFYTIKIQDTFRDDGLQVVVRIADVALSPQEPRRRSPQTEWQTDGFLNEHIVATTRVFFDVNNVRGSASFRVDADLIPDEHSLWWLDTLFFAQMFGVGGMSYEEQGESIQQLGSVSITQGRMLTHPSTMQHQLDWELVDDTLPGRVRYLELQLVDPHYRIASSSNVPPQQHEWWLEEGVAKLDWAKYNIPPELRYKILGYLEEWPMGVDEAYRWKGEMELERKVATEAAMKGVGFFDFDVYDWLCD